MNYEILDITPEDQTEWLIDEDQAEIEAQNLSKIMLEVGFIEPTAQERRIIV